MPDLPPRTAPLISLFAVASDPQRLTALAQVADVEVNRYAIEEVVPVCGSLPDPLTLLTAAPSAEAGAQPWAMLRLLGSGAIEVPAMPGVVAYRGAVGHLQYTTAADRNTLLARSCTALPPGKDTVAVVIPIRKTQAWWNLAQDERQAHFRSDVRHTAIGLPYADRIFRTLYHARYLGARSDYDFITYFEFPRTAAADFRELLAALRDTTRNPEWAYVDLEYEIWTTKIM